MEAWEQFDYFPENVFLRREELREQLMFAKQREREILSVLEHKNQKVTVEDTKQLFQALEQFLQKAEKAAIKQVYRTFIQKIEFDPLNKEDIKITMSFDEAIIHQLNQLYQETVSQRADTVFFVLKRPFTMAI